MNNHVKKRAITSPSDISHPPCEQSHPQVRYHIPKWTITSKSEQSHPQVSNHIPKWYITSPSELITSPSEQSHPQVSNHIPKWDITSLSEQSRQKAMTNSSYMSMWANTLPRGLPHLNHCATISPRVPSHLQVSKQIEQILLTLFDYFTSCYIIMFKWSWVNWSQSLTHPRRILLAIFYWIAGWRVHGRWAAHSRVGRSDAHSRAGRSGGQSRAVSLSRSRCRTPCRCPPCRGRNFSGTRQSWNRDEY